MVSGSVACTGGDSDADPAGDTGGEVSGDAVGDASACSLRGESVLADVAGYVVALGMAGDQVVFVRRDSASTPTAIEKVARDGSGRSVLHTSTGVRRVTAVRGNGAEVLFLEGESTGPGGSALFRVSTSGGAATQIGTGSWKGAERILGVDDTSAFVVYVGSTGPTVVRVNLASGAAETVGTAVGYGTPLHPQLSGDDIFFHAGATGSGSARHVHRLAKSATGATPTPVGDVGSNVDCAFPLGGLVATPTKLACGYSGVAVFARDGSSPTTLIPRNPVSPPNIVVGSDAETLYLAEPSDGVKLVRLKKISTAGGAVGDVACDVRRISWQTSDGYFPLQNAYQVVVGATDVFWTEERREGTAVKYSIRRAPK